MRIKNKNLFLYFITIFSILFFLEVVCRFYQYGLRHRTVEDAFLNPIFRDYYFLGASLKPNSGGSWQGLPSIKINNLGFRGSDFKIEKDQGTFRIVCFGGSTSHSGNYPEKLLELLRKERKPTFKNIEVINAAVPTWNSTQSLIQFITRAIYLDPDLVIKYEGLNDIYMRDYEWLYYLREVDYRRNSGFLKNHSLFYNFFINRITKLKDIFDYIAWERYLNNPKAKMSEISDTRNFSTQVYRMNLENFIVLAKHHNIAIVLITMPLNYDSDASYIENVRRAGPFYCKHLKEVVKGTGVLNDETRAIAKKYDVFLIEMAKSDMNKHPEYFVDLAHFSETGATVFSEKILKELFYLNIIQMDSPRYSIKQ